MIAPGKVGESAPAATRQRVGAAYHAPVPEDHVLFSPDWQRVLHAASRLRGGRPAAYTRWPEPRKA